jgi:hypothetical protein
MVPLWRSSRIISSELFVVFTGLIARTVARNTSKYSRISKALSDCDNVPSKEEFFAGRIFITDSSRDTSLPLNTRSEQTAQSETVMSGNLYHWSNAQPIFTN